MFSSFITLPFVAVPPYTLEAKHLKTLVQQFFQADPKKYQTIASIIDHTFVAKRHLVQPPEVLFEIGMNRGARECHQIYQAAAYQLLIQTALGSLNEAGLQPSDIDAVIFASCTGVSMPSLSTKMLKELGFKETCVNLPVSQWGCAAGVAGLKWADIFCRAHPEAAVLTLYVEVCSSMFHGETDLSSMICNVLFGDAAAGAVVVGPKHKLANKIPRGFGLSHCDEFVVPSSYDWMKYDMSEKGLHFRLAPEVRNSMGLVSPFFTTFLKEHDADISNPDFKVIVHTGGPKILRELLQILYPAFPSSSEDADQTTKDLENTNAYRVGHSFDVLRNFGNIAGATILTILRKMLQDLPEEPRTYPSLMISCGPGMNVQVGLGSLFVRQPSKNPGDNTFGSIVPLNLPNSTKSPIFDCVVVGTGPTGGILTTLLHQFGVNVINFDLHEDVYKHARADHIDAATLRRLNYCDITPKMLANRTVAKCLRKQVVANLDSKEPVALLNPERAGKQFGDGGFCPTNFFSQVDMEKHIRNEIAKSKVPSFYGWSVEDVRKNDSGDFSVIVKHQKTSAKYEIKARRIVGCDGAHSYIRKTFFSSTETRSWDRRLLYQVDFDLGECSLEELNLPTILTQTTIKVSDTVRHLTIIPTGVNNRLRMVLSALPTDPIFSGSNHSALSLSIQSTPELTSYLQQVLSGVFPKLFEKLTILRTVAYSIEPNCLNSWTSDSGSILLAGDAAHLMMPYMGQGFCSGILDVFNLYWKFLYVHCGIAESSLLTETYDKERVPVVEKMISLSSKVSQEVLDLIKEKNPTKRETMVYMEEKDRTKMDVMCPNPIECCDVTGTLFPRVMLNTGSYTDDMVKKANEGDKKVPKFIVWTKRPVEEMDQFLQKSFKASYKYGDVISVINVSEDILDSDWNIRATETWHDIWNKYDYVLVRPDFYIIAAWRSTDEQMNIIERIEKSLLCTLNLL